MAGRWYSLRFDDASLILPAVISATGKRCDGSDFTLVLTPYTGGVVFLARAKNGMVYRWHGGDSLGKPTIACANPRELVSRALTAQPDERFGLNKRWNGAWVGRFLCDGKPRIQLVRKIADATITIESLPGLAWAGPGTSPWAARPRTVPRASCGMPCPTRVQPCASSSRTARPTA